MDWAMVEQMPSCGNAIVLDRGRSSPFYRQIYERVREGIAAGVLRPGDRLPSARGLAAELSTARGTVDAAYALLQGEGYVVSRGAAGSIVSPALPPAQPGAVRRQTRAPLVPVQSPEVSRRGLPPFRLGLPALDAFPRKVWSRLVVRRARMLNADGLDYAEVGGHPPLREAIAAYLAVSRGVRCSPEQVLMTDGYQGALDIIMRVLLRPADAVWFEDPGYFRARQALQAAGASLVPVRVDAEGLRVADGLARSPRARLAVVTPAHQSPLGVTLSLPRRIALLAWAEDAGAWVVEDDYDGEFRYVGRPLPTLKSLDRGDRVLYAASFSKTLFPGLRLGCLVVPRDLLPAFLRVCGLRHGGQAAFEQSVLADFMTHGHFARHLKRMRGLYAARRQALAEALAAVFGDRVSVDLQAGGMHLIARFTGDVPDVELARRAQAAGFAPEALSEWSLEDPPGQGLLLGFTNLAAADALPTCHGLRRATGA